jgi:hypothetical protein
MILWRYFSLNNIINMTLISDKNLLAVKILNILKENKISKLGSIWDLEKLCLKTENARYSRRKTGATEWESGKMEV